MTRFLSLAKTLWLLPAILLVNTTSLMAQACDYPNSTGGGANVPEISPEAVGSAVVIVVAGVLIWMARRSNNLADQAS